MNNEDQLVEVEHSVNELTMFMQANSATIVSSAAFVMATMIFLVRLLTGDPGSGLLIWALANFVVGSVQAWSSLNLQKGALKCKKMRLERLEARIRHQFNQ